MRFALIDKITSLEAGERISAAKNLTMAEEYLADHFPGFPVMPGVMMLESIVQTGAWLMRHTTDFAFSSVLLKEAKGLKFNNFVSPGRTLLVELNVHAWDGNLCTLKAKSSVEGNSAVSARITLEQFNLRDTNPQLADNDERLVAELRSQFAQLWTPPAESA